MQTVFKTLRAKVRSIYKRTAFQRDDSNAVRISLDTNLQLFQEEPYGPGDAEFCAADSELNNPDRSYYFPYAILEVKLSGSEEPVWVKHILETCDVTEVSGLLDGKQLADASDSGMSAVFTVDLLVSLVGAGEEVLQVSQWGRAPVSGWCDSVSTLVRPWWWAAGGRALWCAESATGYDRGWVTTKQLEDARSSNC
jgi:hypothetical protein